MATVANFIQFSDASFNLGGATGADIDLTLTRNIEDVPASGQGALLTWNVQREGTGSVTYEVNLNGNRINAYTVTLDERRAIQEAIDTDNIQQGDNNVEFKVTGGTGILEISDVICFYRQEV